MDLEFAVFSKTFSVDFSEIVSCIDLRQVPYYEIPIIADKGTIRTFKKRIYSINGINVPAEKGEFSYLALLLLLIIILLLIFFFVIFWRRKTKEDEEKKNKGNGTGKEKELIG